MPVEALGASRTLRVVHAHLGALLDSNGFVRAVLGCRGEDPVLATVGLRTNERREIFEILLNEYFR